MKATNFRTRTGRIVFTGADNGTNSLYDPCTKDFDGNPLGNNEDGTPRVSYRFGLAVPKAPGEVHWAYSEEGKIIWAQGHTDHPQAANGSDFSWKVVDGDSATKTAKAKTAPKDKEGYPGHWVYTFNSSYPIKFVNADGSAYLLDRGAVKCGDYVQVAASVVGNTGKSPGVYLNHNVVSLQGLGLAIMGGVDPKTLGFGGGPQPVGMMPVGSMPANAGSPPPPAPGGSQPPPPAPGGSQPPPPAPGAAAPPAVPQVPVSPAPGFVPGSVPPAPGAAPPPPPAAPVAPPAGPQMTAKAAGMTYAAFIAAGWTDATLKAQGYMV